VIVASSSTVVAGVVVAAELIVGIVVMMLEGIDVEKEVVLEGIDVVLEGIDVVEEVVLVVVDALDVTVKNELGGSDPIALGRLDVLLVDVVEDAATLVAWTIVTKTVVGFGASVSGAAVTVWKIVVGCIDPDRVAEPPSTSTTE
jgi:hypothetical protein